MEDIKKEDVQSNQNRVIIIGIFERNFKYCYEKVDNDYYESSIAIQKDGRVENISVIASERIVQYLDLVGGKYAIVEGKTKTRKVRVKENKWEKDIYILAENIQMSTKKLKNENVVEIQGMIQYQPSWHENASEKRAKRTTIRTNKLKDEQIPCNFYGKEAKEICKLPKGTIIRAKGEIKGRNRLRLFKGGGLEVVRIYEVGISNFQKIIT